MKNRDKFQIIKFIFQFQKSSRMNGMSGKLCKSWHFHIPETVFCLLAFTLPELCFALFGPHHKQRSTPHPPTSLSLSAPLLTFSAVLLLSFTHSQHVCSQCEWQTDNYFSFLHFKAYVTGSFSEIFRFFSSNFQKSELQPLNSESVILSFLINKVFVREHSWF